MNFFKILYKTFANLLATPWKYFWDFFVEDDNKNAIYKQWRTSSIQFSKVIDLEQNLLAYVQYTQS